MADRNEAESEWLRGQVALAAGLTDADRVRILRDLLRTAEAIEKTKGPDQLERERRVRFELETSPGRARYLAWVDRLG